MHRTIETFGNSTRQVIHSTPQESLYSDSEELIPLAVLKASIGKAAYAYTDKHVGRRERVGNKGGTLANRLRAVMAGKK